MVCGGAWVAHEVVENFKDGRTLRHEDEVTSYPEGVVTLRRVAGETSLHERAVTSLPEDEAVLGANSCPEAAGSQEVEVVLTLHPGAVETSHHGAGETLPPEAVATSHPVAGVTLRRGAAETSHLEGGVTSHLGEGATSLLEDEATSTLPMVVAMLVDHPATTWAADRPCEVGLP